MKLFSHLKIQFFILLTSFTGFVSAQTIQPQQPDSTTASPVSVMKLRGQNPPTVKSFIVPAVLVSYGLLSLGNNAIRTLDFNTRAELQEDHPLFANHVDNYLQFAPMVAVYGLNLAGVKGKHGVVDQTALYLLSFGIMGATTGTIKRLADRPRPDGSNNYSFPSGHTANAFAAAEFLNQEYRDVSPWIGYAGYTVATATGVLRMYNNKHWVSDVVAGAGIGIASTKIAYLIYPHLRKLVIGKQSMQYSMVPMYQQKAAGIAFSGTF
ncbi:phosphatase PAP2 family protein [Pedobacter sp. MC2016-15]|uniref:phosphatase PAP2 family protein n=1 Tax=Pedobacter sp. MC2016-15 TaxID=2994473 RepID=UPI002247662E|nr:phosphatase PAP2 family protein [Pedobacter sp. MC2016-15]MCX2480960.1 phosphatase PAP2 family protein [Pedobacter sp. MC2016-15]